MIVRPRYVDCNGSTHSPYVEQIVHREAAAQFGQPVDQLLAERAAIEQPGTFGGERLERAGEVGLLQHGAERGRAAADAVE